MHAPDWEQIAADDLARLKDARLYRQRRIVRPIDSTHAEIDGRRFVNFASNNYLGLTHHPNVLAALRGSLERDGAGSGASGLITGYTPAHASAEAALSRWKGTESAVLLPSGYQANAAAVQTFAALGERASGGVRFLLDKLSHASLVDAVRGTGRPFRVFPHNQLSKLRRLLEESEPGQLQVVVTESVFSMDGDTADLHGLAELKARHPFALLLDEAHASGVYGPDGNGYAAECGLQGSVDVTVVTLSKALGCGGGAVCAKRVFCDALVNYGRASIYSTMLPPGAAAAAQAAVQTLRDEPHRQRRLRAVAREVRARWAAAGLGVAQGDCPIIPLILGTEEAALREADRLAAVGFLVLAIRPPTVPKGVSRLRVTVSCDHTDQEIEDLIRAVTARGV